MAKLCLACSSSILKADSVFVTPCCSRPICDVCTDSNPRLTRYNPCLSCLNGIGLVGNRTAVPRNIETGPRNVDGAVRDEETFVVGDDDDDEEPQKAPEFAASHSETSSEPAPAPSTVGDKYFVKKGDTLRGIALRFKVDGRTLCQLNKLPPSTLTTTPHLLHTRSFLLLPPSAQSKLQSSDTQPDPEQEVRRTRERAEKRLQTLTKEVDWRVARAYVALAEDPAAVDAYALKQKELGAAASSSLESMAVAQYLDDLEWEAEQLGAERTSKGPSYSTPKTG
ncbi:LysM domain-containing protein [Mycena chlorophos]|uniref:LysM domain-containing protein n=1 Tax=Mycena chlorophos TaxID=658473 RepID=A0A8H6TGN8_MYCCL|nr:LysM domain-containing protein [Mycena chlorophos]